MKLHIGGTKSDPEWKILNAQPAPYVDFVGDIRDLSAFAEGSVETVYASHVFEHVPLSVASQTLKGILRILSPGGSFLVSVPDLRVLARALLDDQADIPKQIHLLQMIYGGQGNPWDVHYFGWTEPLLTTYLQTSGFIDIRRVDEFGLFSDYSGYRPYGDLISLNLVAHKSARS